MNRTVILSLTFLWVTQPLSGGPTADGSEQFTRQTDALFAKWNRLDRPGCVVAIVQNGKTIYRKGFGAAHLDYRVPNSPQTIFELGSVAKSFTCACIALLMDEGKIHPEDDIRKYVPEMHPFDPPVRVKHLIRCRSGLWAQWHLAQLAGWASEPVQTHYTNNDLLTLLSGQKTLPFPPGSNFQYGTSDYFLLGIIVQRVSGKSLAAFARERLFAPLGMTRTYYEQDTTKPMSHRAVGYYRDHRRAAIWQYAGTRIVGPRTYRQFRSWYANATGSGGWNLKSCLDDLIRWTNNMAHNRLPKGKYLHELFDEGSLLGNKNVLNGRPTGKYRGLKRVQFTGGMPGYLACMAQLKKPKFTVICLTNNSSAIQPQRIGEQLCDLYLGDRLAAKTPSPQSRDRQRKRVEVPIASMKDKVGTFRSDYRAIWRVHVKDGKLWNKNHLDETYELIPLSPTRFRPAKYPNDTFVFKRSGKDGPYNLTLEYPGGSGRFRRVHLADPNKIHRSDYVGRFRSDELEIDYKFKQMNGRLWLRVGNRGWERLRPTVPDEFIPDRRRPFDNRIFSFRRNQQGQVTSCSVGLWRIKGIRFVKVR